jgi:hypothetical protein
MRIAVAAQPLMLLHQADLVHMVQTAFGPMNKLQLSSAHRLQQVT